MEVNYEVRYCFDDIVESYQKHNDISKVDTIRQPDKTIIIDILERLQDIIFPGFFGRKGLKSDYVQIIE